MKLIYAESARQDIHEIYVTISARGSTGAAGRVEKHNRHRCEMLAEFPFVSSKTDEVRMRRAALVRYPAGEKAGDGLSGGSPASNNSWRFTPSMISLWR